jgi:extracellular elastinolytic metalloproteinase
MKRNVGDDDMSVQLVIDALKVSPTNPSFLNMRDSILTALDDKLESNQITAEKYNELRRAIWRAFAKFGMGPQAQSNGSSLNGILADFNPPT